MPGVDYLVGSIYHMVHFNNLQNIFQRRALLSKERIIQERISYQSIANDEVQNLRSRIFVNDISTQKYRPLHSYVPFYFATRTPMLKNKYDEGVQDSIVILEASRSILRNQGVLFTDGNATLQQLSKFGSEKVYIAPATITQPSCRRVYHPDGPWGTNKNHSEFYADVAFLGQLNWDGINRSRYIEDVNEYTRVRSAEVLVPDKFPL